MLFRFFTFLVFLFGVAARHHFLFQTPASRKARTLRIPPATAAPPLSGRCRFSRQAEKSVGVRINVLPLWSPPAPSAATIRRTRRSRRRRRRSPLTPRPVLHPDTKVNKTNAPMWFLPPPSTLHNPNFSCLHRLHLHGSGSCFLPPPASHFKPFSPPPDDAVTSPTTDRSSAAKKRFTLQGFSNLKSPKGNVRKPQQAYEVYSRFSFFFYPNLVGSESYLLQVGYLLFTEPYFKHLNYPFKS